MICCWWQRKKAEQLARSPCPLSHSPCWYDHATEQESLTQPNTHHHYWLKASPAPSLESGVGFGAGGAWDVAELSRLLHTTCRASWAPKAIEIVLVILLQYAGTGRQRIKIYVTAGLWYWLRLYLNLITQDANTKPYFTYKWCLSWSLLSVLCVYRQRIHIHITAQVWCCLVVTTIRWHCKALAWSVWLVAHNKSLLVNSYIRA
jgi:hypothetical protein